MDRKSTTKMTCMKCLKIQPIGQTCSTVSYNNLMMAKYYCRICKPFYDERLKLMRSLPTEGSLDREIYHCPYCNLCRVGKGLLVYTYTSYTCPVCSKSLGDMQVNFGMLDALLAEEKMPDEFSGTQVILCNDCEKRVVPFHWFYHKCPLCGSYNTSHLSSTMSELHYFKVILGG
ncbi:RCHY1, zinc-ribbon [Dillenia turbinata]|uniref:RCHY1, zinc-ribbon n=1 Tax=Dillenia turbinata TaxID=194707 RepID=A0AAN8UUB8_9MAGN